MRGPYFLRTGDLVMRDAVKAEPTYHTSDLYVAAWLLLNDFQFKGLDRQDRRRSTFIFEDRPDRPELVNTFLRGSAQGNLADFVYCIRKAKRLLYSYEQ